jgi:hypothetical protein
MRRILVTSVLLATVALSSCGSSNSTDPLEPTGSSPDVTALALDPSESTINGRGAPDGNGNNNDAPYTSTPVATP